MDIKDDAAMRGLVLGVLYASKEHNSVLVKPASFSPPMTMREILHIGREFKDAGIIKASPSNNGDGYFMRISVHGQAVWTGREVSSLEIDVPPM